MIFIDEIDAVGYARRKANKGMGTEGQGAHREAETTLNQLLNEMDGFEASDNIIVIGATNLIQNLDDALLRPGRFDHKVKTELPNPLERCQILKIHLKNIKNSLN